MKGYAVFTLFIIVIVLAFGSFDTNELNENAFITAIGVDTDQENKGYKLSLQILNPAAFSNNGQGKSPFYVYEKNNKYYGITLSSLTEYIARKVNISHIQVVVINEKLAKEKGIKNIIESLLRPPLYPYTINVLMTKKNNASDFMYMQTKIEPLSSREIASHVRNLKQEAGTASPVYPGKLKGYMEREGREAAVPVIDMNKNSKKGTKEKPSNDIMVNGLSLFRNDKPVAWINNDLSKIYYLMTNQLERTILNAACSENGVFAMHVNSNKTKIKGEIIEKIPHFTIRTKIKGDLAESFCSNNTKRTDTIHALEKQMANEIESKIHKLISKTQKSKTDVIGFGELLKIQDNKGWKEIKDHWYTHFNKAKFDIKVDVEIENVGDSL